MAHLDALLRAAVDARDRMEDEPLLADCFKATAADGGIEILRGDLVAAIAREEASLQAREDDAYARAPPPPPTPFSPKSAKSALTPSGSRRIFGGRDLSSGAGSGRSLKNRARKNAPPAAPP